MHQKFELQNAIVAALKSVANDLGRPPTRAELEQLRGFKKHQIDITFGTYTAALAAAGFAAFDTRKKSNKKLVQEFFSADLSQLLSKACTPASPLLEPYPNIICIGDMHLPWWHEPTITMLYLILEQEQPDYIIQMGDLYDFFSFGKYPRSHLLIRPDEELRIGRQLAETFWQTVRRICPRAKLVQLIGNHDLRPMKRVLESGSPELEPFFNFKSFFEFEGVHTQHDAREPYRIKEFSFIHGHLSQAGAHRNQLKTHVAHGHTHRGGVVMNKRDGRHLVEIDCGHVGDASKKVFNYTAVREPSWTRGYAQIKGYCFAFIPLE